MTYSIDREVCQILESFYDEGIRYNADKNATIEEVHSKNISKTIILHCLEWGGGLS